MASGHATSVAATLGLPRSAVIVELNYPKRSANHAVGPFRLAAHPAGCWTLITKAKLS